LDGSFIKATEDQEKKGDPYVDPTKLKMGLIGPKGESLVAGKKTEGENKKKAFFPVVNKWNMYEGEDQEGKKQKRLGAPYFYPKSELKEVKKQVRDDKGRRWTDRRQSDHREPQYQSRDPQEEENGRC
jgi:hypothetical protein